MTHLSVSRNPTDPLLPRRRGFADGDGAAASTGDADAELESQQELSSRLGRDAPVQALLATIRVRWAPHWAATRREAAANVAAVQGEGSLWEAMAGGGTLRREEWGTWGSGTE